MIFDLKFPQAECRRVLRRAPAAQWLLVDSGELDCPAAHYTPILNG